jgi:8-oxo-dGTP diphosphatase
MSAIRALPELYPITGAAASTVDWWSRLERLAGSGWSLIQLRPAPGAPLDLREAAVGALARCALAGAGLVLNGPPALALELGLAGLHLNARRLREYSVRPVPGEMLLGASCHSAAELARARTLGADYAFLSPVCTTRSHPGAPALGWPAFTKLAESAGLPVYALGGVGPADLEMARAAGACGVAGISADWG